MNENPSANSFDPMDEACHLLISPAKRHAIQTAVKQGRVTARDIYREFPAFSKKTTFELIRRLIRGGVLKYGPTLPGDVKGPIQTYEIADLTAIRELHQWLSELLEDTHG
ncbi:hypothetical protein [Deinococcus cellulosilyticus]|uniref:Uncharacterized protein n=1 Tax=Deinococcus cellulosilyticus (strain DSM 18568 / NBRC 106333 / KACC 11606 / 5516J-15) TaxID=1223518 RepID=A0A511MW36_DEIC1|nr:hypothetical protein [Deinococcus cellulosilyticus]GEM44794.1 hypothetical protein DC3_04290 [Deinococcus cellulosilyticus NBRC 106333 = KACC 11606]